MSNAPMIPATADVEDLAVADFGRTIRGDADNTTVDIISYHEEFRGRAHEYVSLSDPKRGEKAAELRKKGWVLMGQSQIELDYMEPLFKFKAYITNYKGPFGPYRDWVRGDGSPENPGHPRTWVVPITVRTMRDAIEHVKSLKLYSEVVELPWDEFKKLP